MKCPNCNAPLMIEDERCRYCGTESPYFKKHREDMREFTEEFEETQQEVLQKATHTTRLSAGVAVILFLVCINLALLIMHFFTWDLQYKYQEWLLERNAVEIRATLQEYAEAEDILGLRGYFQHGMGYYSTYGTSLADYSAVDDATSNYHNLYRYLMELTVMEEDTYYETDELTQNISKYLDYFQDSITPTEYSKPERFNETHLATMETERYYLEALVNYYLDISPEELPALLEMSSAHRMIAIEEGVQRYEQSLQ